MNQHLSGAYAWSSVRASRAASRSGDAPPSKQTLARSMGTFSHIARDNTSSLRQALSSQHTAGRAAWRGWPAPHAVGSSCVSGGQGCSLRR